MDDYRRYAVYHIPGGPLGAFGAAWLGWDCAAAAAVAQPGVPGLDLPAITAAPRRYGFHATLKAPFRLAAGATPQALRDALRAFAGWQPAVTLPALRLTRPDGFLALTADHDAALSQLEAGVVRGLDAFRAALTPDEVARRQPERLTPRQRALLEAFGYPWVLEAFRFHMTLTGPLDPATAKSAEAALAPRLAALPLAPYRLDTLSLTGEDDGGRFHVIDTVPLQGPPAG